MDIHTLGDTWPTGMMSLSFAGVTAYDEKTLTVKPPDGTPAIAIDENGEQTTLPDFGTNKATVDAEWERIMELKFDCPSIPSQMLDENADKLGLTLGTMRMIKPLVATE